MPVSEGVDFLPVVNTLALLGIAFYAGKALQRLHHVEETLKKILRQMEEA